MANEKEAEDKASENHHTGPHGSSTAGAERNNADQFEDVLTMGDEQRTARIALARVFAATVVSCAELLQRVGDFVLAALVVGDRHGHLHQFFARRTFEPESTPSNDPPRRSRVHRWRLESQ